MPIHYTWMQAPYEGDSQMCTILDSSRRPIKIGAILKRAVVHLTNVDARTG